MQKVLCGLLGSTGSRSLRFPIAPNKLVATARYNSSIPEKAIPTTSIESKPVEETVPSTPLETKPAAEAEPVAPVDVEDYSIGSLGKDGLIDTHLIDALKRCGFNTLTPVQQKTVRPILENKQGVVARAKTGTGKTLAFGIPLLNQQFKMLKDKDPRDRKAITGVHSLIIAPTRDLAFQIREEFNKVKMNSPLLKKTLKIEALVGGDSRGKQLSHFNSWQPPSMIVATPGRLIDMLSEPSVRRAFAGLQYKVLDEADRLLDIGFKDDLLQIDKILTSINTEEQSIRTLLFSATIDKTVTNFAQDLMGKEFTYINTVDTNEPETHELIKQTLVTSEGMYESMIASFNFVLQQIAENPNTFKPIIFLPTVKGVDYYRNILHMVLREENLRFSCIGYHGKMSQTGRDKAVKRFKNLSKTILVTSDVGARGLDFPDVTHVIQVSMASETANYVHRIGRTARAGKSGAAVTFLADAELKYVDALARVKIKFENRIESQPNVALQEMITNFNAKDYELNDECRGMISASYGFYFSLIQNYRLDANAMMETLSEQWTKMGLEGSPRIPQAVLMQMRNLQKRGNNKGNSYNLRGSAQRSPMGRRYNGDGGAQRSDRYDGANKKGGRKFEFDNFGSDDAPSYKSKDGFKRGGGFRDGGFNKDRGSFRDGGFNKDRVSFRDGGAPREGGFNKDRGFSRNRKSSRDDDF
ncbi:hypothetical protein BABINDRAFT_160028 [Babjeviella inositovora NRRL Y-12698]|uniref:ATP-dependent RNA helicase n=1 Tax=Babjeviella inositovora NRRL Y-12698 TaxID=984486 RepID=A0A1E3QVV9_9ASCO|nr:uncharacterized protein BABINDRAFT_160028 [Babjeviella inositovora NRRL Y-12698]ODQ81788.1 hypothetical protein BABINDRAFT_160028 [Babjeviella inositovora NRRL Y-12698]